MLQIFYLYNVVIIQSLPQEEVYKLMETDIYPRFLKSPEYAAMMKPLENGGSYSKG